MEKVDMKVTNQEINDDANSLVEITTWKDAVCIYSELDLDRLVRGYITFVKRGKMCGFPVINIWSKCDYNEQLCHAMKYLLDRSLNLAPSNNGDKPESYKSYHIEINMPFSDEVKTANDSLLYSRAVDFLRFTQSENEYIDPNLLMAPESKNNDKMRNDAIRRLKVIMETYDIDDKHSFLNVFLLMFYSLSIAVLLPDDYQNWMSYGLILVSVLSFFYTKHSDIKERKRNCVKPMHVWYLTENALLKDIFDKKKISSDSVNYFVLKEIQQSVTDLNQKK